MKKLSLHTILLGNSRFSRADTGDPGIEKSPASDLSVLRETAAQQPMKMIITGGVTGGHLFPGIAVAESFLKRNPENRVLFVSKGSKLEKEILPAKGFQVKWIHAEGIKGRGPAGKFKSIFKIPRAILAAMAVIKDFKPDLVLGMGGYSSGPVAIAAWLMGIKIVLHEQNTIPGLTNRFLAGLADKIFVSFEDTEFRFNNSKTILTGNPVRKDILEEKEEKAPANGNFTVLVLGGSQGAHSINIAVMDSLSHLRPENKIFFIHQTGQADEGLVRDTYMRLNIQARVKAFFNEMAPLYRESDLIICRAGATTVAEISAMGKPALFIPYPFAADDHQSMNAGAMAEAGAADIMYEQKLTGLTLAKKIETLLHERTRLKKMAEISKSFGKPMAAEEITSQCSMLVQRQKEKLKPFKSVLKAV